MSQIAIRQIKNNDCYSLEQMYLEGIKIGLATFKTNSPGLSLFETLQRTKEIGVRKVLGASVNNIVLLLSMGFLKLVPFAIAVAVPISLIILHRWLQEFAYHISLEWWIFFLLGMVAVVVAFCTIYFNAVRAALANPVKSLKVNG